MTSKTKQHRAERRARYNNPTRRLRRQVRQMLYVDALLNYLGPIKALGEKSQEDITKLAIEAASKPQEER